MSATPKQMRRCALCGALTVEGERFVVEVHHAKTPGAPTVALQWCLDCAPADPFHQRLADTFGLEDGPVALNAMADAWEALHQQIVARLGMNGPREVITIVGDIRGGGVTFRGAGVLWGIMSPRAPLRAARYGRMMRGRR